MIFITMSLVINLYPNYNLQKQKINKQLIKVQQNKRKDKKKLHLYKKKIQGKRIKKKF